MFWKPKIDKLRKQLNDTKIKLARSEGRLKALEAVHDRSEKVPAWFIEELVEARARVAELLEKIRQVEEEITKEHKSRLP